MIELRRVAGLAGEAMDVLVCTPEELEEMKERPFIRRALKNGKVLYEAGRDEVTR